MDSKILELKFHFVNDDTFAIGLYCPILIQRAIKNSNPLHTSISLIKTANPTNAHAHACSIILSQPSVQSPLCTQRPPK